jgi:hypothetical protein
VQTVSSSVIYSSGSNIFGNNIANTQVFTGSMNLTGSLTVVTTGTEFQVNANGVKFGNVIGDAHSITGSVGISGSLSGSSAVFRVSADRNLATRFDTNIVLSAQSDSGAPESLRIYADTFRLFTATTAVGLTERLTISNTGAATFSSTSGIGATIIADWNRSATNDSQLYIKGATNGNKQLRIGYDTTGNVGYIQALTSGTSVDNLLLNPSGGEIVVNGSTPQNVLATRGNLTINGATSILNLSTSNTNAAYFFHNGTDLVMVNSKNGSMQLFTNDTERMRITSGGIIYALNGGVDATYQPMIGGMYTGNNNETNLISTAVSSAAGQSGFRFDVSNGAGSTGRTTSMTINRSSVSIVGSLSKGSGSFRIKHPLLSKKDTHQLVHSFIEGPQADLIYSGGVTLVNGRAVINIDEVATMTEGTFEALCRNIRVFTSNETSWDNVRGKVEGNILTIECQNTESTDEISWLVIGERQDEHMMDTEWTDENGKVIVEPLIPVDPGNLMSNNH